MLTQDIYLKDYDWKVIIYYHISCYYINEILELLKEMGCSEAHIQDAYDNMKDCKLNTGITYSNKDTKTSLIVISKTSEPAQFMNSLIHEQHHLISHIEDAYSINPLSEESAYLAGYVAELMYPKAKRFLCKCCSE